MWASCCNWLCLDTQSEDERNGNSQREAYTNSGYNAYPSSPAPEPTCKTCGRRFDPFFKKLVCMDCKKNFCSNCSSQLLGPCMCFICHRLHVTAFERGELMKLKVKELRDYLSLHEVSTEMCTEKEDLVQLVLSQQSAVERMRSSVNTSQAPQPESVGNETSSATQGAFQMLIEDQQTTATSAFSSREAETPTLGDEPRTEEDAQSSDVEDMSVPGRRASLSDLNSVEDIDSLSVRQLKEILARNFVNYKGCCEKWELMERVSRLYNEQKDLQKLVSNNEANSGDSKPPAGVDENLCKICMDAPIDCVLLDCGHMVTCTKCGKRMSECPICRQYVVRAVHVFRS
ncbi:E3 ubiquitin-protein ligase rififylin isoform X2 [Erpetoichthys calabaricus]|nr:E3 ubiquitin-protein ligase rififylin isoform X2 [Erpetoichthys calabaricus]